MPPIDYLELVDLLEIANSIIPNCYVRDLGLLESAAARPKTTIMGVDAYKSFEEKAAALMHALARNHPLLDGNKRLAWSAVRVFCLLNGRDIKYSVVETELLIVGIARGDYEVQDITGLLRIVKPPN